MKTKKTLSTLLAILFVFPLGVLSYAAGIDGELADEEEQLIYESELHYREMDSKAGAIIEKYDTLLNGENELDYYELATSLSEDPTDRITAMNMIVTIYTTVTNQEKTYLKSYMESYAPYTDNEDLIKFTNSLTKGSISTSSYSKVNAVNYAKSYYNKFNPNYPNLTSLCGDCANFVSQCLYAGGKAMDGTWYVRKKNSKYPKPETISQLNQSWALADPSPWISAKEFNNYWKKKANKSFEYTTAKYLFDRETVFADPIYSGDVVQFKEKVGFWWQAYHTMIVVRCDVDNKDYILAGHSVSTVNRSLLQACRASRGKKIQLFHIT